MACPPTTISLLPFLLTFVPVGAAWAVNRLLQVDSEMKADVERLQELRGAAAHEAAAREAAAREAAMRPVAVTPMKDFGRLEAALTGPGRRVERADGMLVLITREATLAFRHGADNLIAAEFGRGDAVVAKALLDETQARYLAAVREDTAAQLLAKAPAAGWTVAKRETARDGSIEVTLHKPTPRKKKAVAIG